MRRPTILAAIALLLAAVALPSRAQAFDCTTVTNVVGVVDRAVRMGQTMEVKLKDAVAYDLREIGTKGAIPLDVSIDIVARYVKGNHTLADRPPATGIASAVVISTEAYEATSPQPGEIVINSPPQFGGCRLASIGIFSAAGKPRLFINDGPQGSYTLGAATIRGEVGKKISCKGGMCIAKGAFTLDGAKLILKPGETFDPNAGPIAQIELLESSFPKEMEIAPGGKWHLRYVMRLGE